MRCARLAGGVGVYGNVVNGDAFAGGVCERYRDGFRGRVDNREWAERFRKERWVLGVSGRFHRGVGIVGRAIEKDIVEGVRFCCGTNAFVVVVFLRYLRLGCRYF